jgi:large-conductance mechanosensitive channel
MGVNVREGLQGFPYPGNLIDLAVAVVIGTA